VLGVLSAGVLAGVVLGVALSLAWLVAVTTAPSMPLLGREPGTQAFRELEGHPDDESFVGIAVVRLDGGLFFATADALEDRVRGLIEAGDGMRAIVLDLEGVDFVDSQGAGKLREVAELAARSGVALRVARVKAGVGAVLGADGALAELSAGHVHGSVHEAVEAQLAEERSGSAPAPA
jgi:anti-anti-sigma factor